MNSEESFVGVEFTIYRAEDLTGPYGYNTTFQNRPSRVPACVSSCAFTMRAKGQRKERGCEKADVQSLGFTCLRHKRMPTAETNSCAALMLYTVSPQYIARTQQYITYFKTLLSPPISVSLNFT